jgi:hypothetical protein
MVGLRRPLFFDGLGILRVCHYSDCMYSLRTIEGKESGGARVFMIN